MILGFTGTQQGGSSLQVMALRKLLKQLGAESLHHGDCVGADAQAHNVAIQLGLRIYLHPPRENRLRAFCVGPGVFAYDPLPYLERNKAVVRTTEALVVMPRTAAEELRSGTWATYRYAKKLGRTRYVIEPGGRIRQEND